MLIGRDTACILLDSCLQPVSSQGASVNDYLVDLLTMSLSSIISSLRAHTRSQRNNSFQANTELLRWRLAEMFVRTWDLGFTAFGGPPVHFQILHRRFVQGVGFGGESKWIDEQTVSKC
jgi:hypothetical protein